MAITQKQIAQSLGVSHQLVSFALNGGGTVSEAKRREILAAAHEMGYRRNELARAMVTGRSRIIGVVTYAETAEHISTIVAGALDEAVRDGYAVKMLHLAFNGTREEMGEVARRCITWQLDGAVAISLRPEAVEVLASELGDSGCALAYVENFAARPGEIVVGTDDRGAFREAVAHLASLGHKRIVHLCGPDEHLLSQARNAHFLAVLREFGLPLGPGSLLRTHGTNWWDRQGTERAAHALLDEPADGAERPTAVICAGDASAMILQRVARKRGVRVPKELSVVGFGNFALGAYADPPLTTIGQPFHAMGRLAMKRLIEHITSQAPSAPGTCDAPAFDELPAHLVVRESTGPAA